MDLSSEIFEWAISLPQWQRSLLRRVSVAPLANDDLLPAADAVAAAFGVGGPLPSGPPLTEPELGLASAVRPNVRLTTLGSLSGVGVVAPGQTLKFAPSGLTIVYGLNAAGKSSYVRVLKHACRSADRRSEVRSDVYADVPPPRRTAKVQWEIESRARAREIDLAKSPPDELSSISVFDARCAAVYVAGDDVVAYVPTALYVFKRLADAQMQIRDELRQRARSLRDEKPSFDDIPPGSAARALVDSLSAATNVAALRALADVAPSERARLDEIDRALALSDPRERRARVLRSRGDAADANLLAERIAAVAEVVGDDALRSLAYLRREAEDAAAAVELAAREAFADEPADGLGSEPWRQLWDAARRFCAHAGATFPPTSPGERCPLCLQELGDDARARFESFEAFVRGEVEAKARVAAARREQAVAALRPELASACRSAFLEALGERERELYDCVTTWLEAAEQRRTCAVVGDDAATLPLPADPAPALRAWSTTRAAEADTLERATDSRERASLERDALELRGRIALQPRVAEAEKYVTALARAAKLDEACRALVTTGITQKQGALTDLVLTRTLRNKLNGELRALGLDHVQVDVARSGSAGSSHVRMALRGAKQKAPLGEVLSEGEQGAIAMAFFLAELGAAEHDGGVIFDDPVSSLDLQRRSHIARRLCEEAERRQVIVFTHDLPFVIELRDEARSADVSLHEQTIWRSGREAGRVQDDAPFHAMSVGKRIRVLKQRLVEWPKPQEEASLDDAWGRVKDFYNDLRETWEMAVEEALFRGVVRRYAPQVHTKMLRQVTISDQDKEEVAAGMTRCSRFLHSEPAARGVALPDRAELNRDLEELESFVKRKNKEAD